MGRTRRSAKQAGSRFERVIADHLNAHLDGEIDRKVKTGVKDKGDIAGVTRRGKPIAVECKDCAVTRLPEWVEEARKEAENSGSLCGIVIHKRRGVGDPGRQWVTMTVDDLITLLDDGGSSRDGHDPVSCPQHYASLTPEPIWIAQRYGFLIGNAFKYIARAGHKTGASEEQDLGKADWLLNYAALHWGAQEVLDNLRRLEQDVKDAAIKPVGRRQEILGRLEERISDWEDRAGREG